IYGVALKLTLPLDVLFNSFNQGFQPVYFSIRKRMEADQIPSVTLPELFLRIWLAGVVCFAVVVLMGPWFVATFIQEAYHGSIPLMRIIAVGFLFHLLYLLQVSDLYYSKRTFSIPLITGTGLVVNLAFVYFF